MNSTLQVFAVCSLVYLKYSMVSNRTRSSLVIISNQGVGVTFIKSFHLNIKHNLFYKKNHLKILYFPHKLCMLFYGVIRYIGKINHFKAKKWFFGVKVSKRMKTFSFWCPILASPPPYFQISFQEGIREMPFLEGN